MTKEQTLHSFWSSFGLTAYDENTVPDNANLPYITYQVKTSSFGEPVALTGSLWYRSSSWSEITSKATQIGASLIGGKMIQCDGGGMWIKRGVPFSQRINDSSDDSIRRIYINIEVEFISAY